MKTLILALVVLLVVSQGEALKCWCGGSKTCSGRTETCRDSNNVCASVRFPMSPVSNFWGCYELNACRRLNQLGSSCSYCTTDLCQ